MKTLEVKRPSELGRALRSQGPGTSWALVVRATLPTIPPPLPDTPTRPVLLWPVEEVEAFVMDIREGNGVPSWPPVGAGVDSTLLTFFLGPLENSISEKSSPKGPEFLTLFDSGLEREDRAFAVVLLGCLALLTSWFPEGHHFLSQYPLDVL